MLLIKRATSFMKRLAVSDIEDIARIILLFVTIVNVKICGPPYRRSNKNKRDETKAEETDRQAEPVEKDHDR